LLSFHSEAEESAFAFAFAFAFAPEIHTYVLPQDRFWVEAWGFSPNKGHRREGL
jgi:hypothetical protein